MLTRLDGRFCVMETERDLFCFLSAYNRQCDECRDYQAGKTQPAYPVPAIRIDCIIHPEGVYFWMNTLAGYIFLKEISSGRM